MHALNVHCGSFLYDALREQWLTEEEREVVNSEKSRRQSVRPTMSSTEKADVSAGADEEAYEGDGEKGEVTGLPREWPLFETSALTTIRVVSYKQCQGNIYYVVQPTLEGFKWSVEKTYSDFAQLHKILVDAYGMDPALLPARKVLSFFGRSKPQHLQEMQEKLSILLRSVLQKFPIPPIELLDFCAYPFCDVLSITQSLALYFFQEGDRVLAENKAIHMNPIQLRCINRRLILPMASSGTGSLREDFGNLLDFVIQLAKLKIAPSTEELFFLLPSEQLNFELTLLKNLTYLLIDSIDVRQLRERHVLTGQLEGLDIRRCLSSLKEILLVYPPDSPLPPLSSFDLTNALPWTRLKTICFKLNNITSIDKSVLMSPYLERLDLSYNSITELDHITELPHLSVVDLSHNKISDLFDLHTRIGNISKLGLAHNQVVSLEGLSKCLSLQYLDVSYNLIADTAEVYHLSRLHVLEDLHLAGNPIAQSVSYRSLVFSQLPSTDTKVILDSKKATQDELELSASMMGSKGHKRIPSRTADIKPDRDEFVAEKALDEFEESSSVTNQLEEMRKVGGNKWLSIFNAERSKQSAASTTDDDVVSRSPRERRKRSHKHHHHSHTHSKRTPHKEKLEASSGESFPSPTVSHNPFPGEVEDESLSEELLQEIRILQKEKLQLSLLPVTVLEYAGPLHTLSGQDVDQMLLHSPLEECMLTVDTSIMRVQEIVQSTRKTRSQRDLTLLEDIRFHEGQKKGVCLRFSQFSGNSLWVIYCVRDRNTLARLYVAMNQGLQSIATPLGSGSVASGTSTPDLLVSVEADDLHIKTPTGGALVVALDSKLHKNEDVDTLATPSHPLEYSTENSPDTLQPSTEKGMSGTSTSHSTRSPSPSSNVRVSKDTSPSNVRVSKDTSPSNVRVSKDTSPSNVCVSKDTSPSNVHVSASTGAAHSARVSPTESAVKPKEEEEEEGVGSRGDGEGGGGRHKQAVEGREEKSQRQTKPSRSQTKLNPHTGKEASRVHREAAQQTFPGAKRVPKKTRLTESTDSGTVREGSTEPHEGKLANPAANNTSLSLSIAGGIETRPLKLTTDSCKIVKKPGIDRQSLVDFFIGKIACERSEILMNILWSGASLTSTPGCEIEVGLFITDKGIYLLQVLDPEKHPSQNLSWYSENSPLVLSFHASHLSLVRIKMGIFDQSITFQCIHRGSLKSLVVFPRTYESMVEAIENLKAALEACGCTHSTMTIQESIFSAGANNSSVLIVNTDMSDMQKLKESLVRPKVVAQICNDAMEHMDQTTLSSFSEDCKKMCEDLAAKFEIVQYIMVSEINFDILPISNGTVHFKPRVLILTNKAIFLCRDETAAWPTDPDSPVSPPYPCYSVLDSYPIEAVSGIEMCDKAQALVSVSDPVYEFRILFQESNQAHSSGGKNNWQLCIHGRRYIDQFFTCLAPIWQDLQHSQLPITHTAESLTSSATTSPHKVGKRIHRSSGKSITALYNPSFYKSKALVAFASLSSSERLQFFRENISEAQFMKADEVPLSIFLAICSTTRQQEYAQIEVCVVASNYAVYLLSDVDNIRKWLDNGGPSSFSRMSLLNKQGASDARCFFRLWSNDIKELKMGFFYLSMQISTAKTDQGFTVHSQDTSAMLSLLSALSCSIKLLNTFEEKVFTELLSDYIDLCSDSLSSKTNQLQSNVRPNVEFQEPSKESLETLKQILLCISPSIRKSSTIEQSTSGLQIILGQVMLMIEEVNIRDSHSIQYQLRLVLLSNYGLFICGHSAGDSCTPAILDPTDLTVKRWCHIDLIDHVEVDSQPQFQQCAGHTFTINLKSRKGADGSILTMVAQNSELLNHFLYYLSLLWHERSDKDKKLPIIRI